MPYNVNEFFRQVSEVYSVAELGQAGRRDIIKGLYEKGGAEPPDFHYIGLLSERENMFGTPNTFPHAMQALHDTLRLGPCPVSCQVQAGYVLLMSDDDWCIAANDAWMLGGIHTGKHYKLMSPPVASSSDARTLLGNIMLTPPGRSHPLSVTGREILGLIFYGYQVRLDNGHLVFHTHDPRGVSATFSAYRQGVQEIEAQLRRHSDRVSFIQSKLAPLFH